MQNLLNVELDQKDLFILLDKHPIIVLAGSCAKQGLSMLAKQLLNNLTDTLTNFINNSRTFKGFDIVSLAMVAERINNSAIIEKAYSINYNFE